MARRATPLDFWKSSIEMGLLLLETQLVMSYRLLGMAGLRAATKGENRRMVDEKAPAFFEATLAATRATMSGGGPDEVMGAWMRPLRRKTRANARRLGKRGAARG